MANDERDESSGKFSEKYPREEFIRAIEDEGGMAGTTGIAEQVGCRRETAYKKLSNMADDGEVNKQMVGNSLVWSVNNG